MGGACGKGEFSALVIAVAAVQEHQFCSPGSLAVRCPWILSYLRSTTGKFVTVKD